jgi:Uma2 family endonuclease
MTTQSQTADPFVVLYGVPWKTYEAILDALGEYHLRHTYDRGTLEMRGLLYGVDWRDYQKFLDALGDISLRHTYDRGTLEMMSPRKDHDWVKRIVGRLIEAMCLELNIPVQSIGSTTLTSESVERGLQPDEAYYIANEPLVRGKPQFEPDRDPPPDLVVEVDVTNSSVRRLPAFAAMKVPEIWRYDGEQLQFLRLTESGEYAESPTSAAFPFLGPQDVARFLDLRTTTDENSLIRSFLEWARERSKQE